MMWIPKVANVADDHVEGTILDGSGVMGLALNTVHEIYETQCPLPFQRIDHKETCFL